MLGSHAPARLGHSDRRGTALHQHQVTPPDRLPERTRGPNHADPATLDSRSPHPRASHRSVRPPTPIPPRSTREARTPARLTAACARPRRSHRGRAAAAATTLANARARSTYASPSPKVTACVIHACSRWSPPCCPVTVPRAKRFKPTSPNSPSARRAAPAPPNARTSRRTARSAAATPSTRRGSRACRKRRTS